MDELLMSRWNEAFKYFVPFKGLVPYTWEFVMKAVGAIENMVIEEEGINSTPEIMISKDSCKISLISGSDQDHKSAKIVKITKTGNKKIATIDAICYFYDFMIAKSELKNKKVVIHYKE